MAPAVLMWGLRSYHPPMSLTWLITGANRGLGLELVRQLAASDADVMATARNPSNASDLNALGVEVHRLDQTNPDDVAALATALAGRPLDILVNNAALGGGGSSLASLDVGELNDFFDANATGPLRLTQALLPNLRAGGRKLIVNLTSRMGSIEANAGGGSYGYRASKAALNMINRNLAIELGGEGFTCVVLHPGWVQTDMGGAGAPLTPQESVSAMLRVIDDLDRDANGQFLNYDGTPIPW